MLARLTLRLAIAPEAAWPRYSAECRDGSLPPPLLHVAPVALISMLATMLGGMLRPGFTTAGVLLHGAVVLSGGLAAGAMGVTVAPMLVRDAGDPTLLARFAVGAVQPLLLCGALNVLPILPANAFFVFVGAGASAWSARVGAGTLLGLEGSNQNRAAMQVTALMATPVFLAALARWALPA